MAGFPVSCSVALPPAGSAAMVCPWQTTDAPARNITPAITHVASLVTRMAFYSPVRLTTSLSCLEQDKLIPSDLSPRVVITASYRSGSRLHISTGRMHIRNKGDMSHAAAAPIAVVTTLLSAAGLSPAPALPGQHVDGGEPLLVLNILNEREWLDLMYINPYRERTWPVVARVRGARRICRRRRPEENRQVGPGKVNRLC